MTLDAALRALGAVETTEEVRTAIASALTTAQAEAQRLRLRVQDLEQQLARRKGGTVGAVGVTAPSLFGEAEPGLAAGVPPAVSQARGRPRTRGGTPKARGRKPLDPALPREVIRLPDPPSTARVDPLHGRGARAGLHRGPGSASAAARAVSGEAVRAHGVGECHLRSARPSRRRGPRTC